MNLNWKKRFNNVWIFNICFIINNNIIIDIVIIGIIWNCEIVSKT